MSACHNSGVGAESNMIPEYNSIASWVEVIIHSGIIVFRFKNIKNNNTVKPLLSGPHIKRIPASIKTNFSSVIFCKTTVARVPWVSAKDRFHCNNKSFKFIFLADIVFLNIVQHINTTDYRLCIKEIHKPNGYDPVKVTTLMIGE